MHIWDVGVDGVEALDRRVELVDARCGVSECGSGEGWGTVRHEAGHGPAASCHLQQVASRSCFPRRLRQLGRANLGTGSTNLPPWRPFLRLLLLEKARCLQAMRVDSTSAAVRPDSNGGVLVCRGQRRLMRRRLPPCLLMALTKALLARPGDPCDK